MKVKGWKEIHHANFFLHEKENKGQGFINASKLVLVQTKLPETEGDIINYIRSTHQEDIAVLCVCNEPQVRTKTDRTWKSSRVGNS